jgi:hypothetical protein
MQANTNDVYPYRGQGDGCFLVRSFLTVHGATFLAFSAPKAATFPPQRVFTSGFYFWSVETTDFSAGDYEQL